MAKVLATEVRAGNLIEWDKRVWRVLKSHHVHVGMDKESLEQLTLPTEFLEGQAGYLIPITDVQINFHNERPIGIQMPPTVILTVVETEPNLKGATATGSF